MAISSVRELRRTQILEAARSLIAAEGLEGFTIGALEDRLEFSRGVITYHFRNKDAIVEAVLESAVEDIDGAIQAAVRPHASPVERLRAAIKATVKSYLEQVEAARVLFSFWSRLHTDPRARELNARLYERYRGYGTELIEKGQQAGVFEKGPIAEQAALVVGIIIGIVTQAYFEPGCIDPEAVAEEAARAMLARLGVPSE